MSALSQGLELRRIREEEHADWSRQIARQFGSDRDEATIEARRALLPADLDRVLGVFDRGRLVATALGIPFRMTVPGGRQLGCLGVSAVGVQASHRRRGIMRQLMTHLLDSARARAEPLSALLASESGIYGRFGYGPAVHTLRMRVAKPWARLSQPVDVAVDLVDSAQALEQVPPLYRQAQRATSGMLDPPDGWFRYSLEEDREAEGGFSKRFHAVVAGRGYALYRLNPQWDETGAAAELAVEELVAVDDEAVAALWQFCFDVDLVGTVTARLRPVDDPLPLMLPEPVRVRRTADEPVYVRLVDLPVALASRTYAGRGSVVFEVIDASRPENTGRWRLETSGQESRCERTGQPADIELDVEDLGATYLGGTPFGVLVRARRVRELTAGAARRADALFGVDRAPWQPWEF